MKVVLKKNNTSLDKHYICYGIFNVDISTTFSKFYHRHSELFVKYNIGLKTLQQGISEPIF